MKKSIHKVSDGQIRGEFNNASARRALVDRYLSLFIMCKAGHQYNERPRALALLNLPQYTFSMLFSRADLRESMIFYDFFLRPMFARMFSLLVYLRSQCSSLKQEHLSYLFIDSL